MKIRQAIACYFVTGLGVALFAGDPAGPVPFAQLPPAVQKGIQAQVGNGTLGAVSREEANGVVTYSVEITKSGLARDYTVDENGVLIGMEVTFQETPLAVQNTIRAQVGQGAVETIDKTISNGELSYDVDWKSKDGVSHSFTVLESGKLESVELNLEETPPPVRATITKEIGNSKLVSITKNFDAEGNAYDITIEQNGVERDFEVAENGQLESRQVLLTELPPPVMATIQHTVGAGKLLRVDRLTEKVKNVQPFEVESIVNGKPYFFLVGPKGAFLGVTQ